MDAAEHPSPDRPDPARRITLTDSGSLIAAIPSVIGFHPQASLVVVTLQDDMISDVVRMDLAPPPQYGALITGLIRSVRQFNGKTAVLVIVSDQPDPRHDDLVRGAVAALADITVPVRHALSAPSTAGGVPWRCYLHDDCEGEVPDSTATELAAEMVLAGNVTFHSRDDLNRLLEPPDVDRVTRISSLIDTAAQTDRTTSAKYMELIRDAITSDTLPTTDEDLVRLALALSDYRVRDACLGYALDPQAATAAETLWLEKHPKTCRPRTAPRPQSCWPRAPVFVAPDALATIAVNEARKALRGHNLADVLYGAIIHGVPVAQVRQLVTKAATDARADIETDADAASAR
ncbi:DUF4192 domain-containing protein [Kutzneria sp. 744]|uniref:DUF4192 domain-containing protein n=1 Tax=Kutzneria sp. (strain 744) TaxID=345341 RepID=UPI0003EEB04C|nr:DUF4192 domain-containing protein [Kutzneria sp. 744]EWM19678.1 vegetative cell wall protein gp1 [Kutzneria sp. 744]